MLNRIKLIKTRVIVLYIDISFSPISAHLGLFKANETVVAHEPTYSLNYSERKIYSKENAQISLYIFLFTKFSPTYDQIHCYATKERQCIEEKYFFLAVHVAQQNESFEQNEAANNHQGLLAASMDKISPILWQTQAQGHNLLSQFFSRISLRLMNR